MNKRVLPFVVLLVIASFFIIAFKSQGKNEKDPNPKFTKVLRNVGILLEQGHYSPKLIDDAFSKTVFTEYIKDLDADKKIFLESDIKELSKKYSAKIDDEIHGTQLESFYSIDEVYKKRMTELVILYNKFLKTPFSFNVDEVLVLEETKTNFAKTDAEREDIWRKYIKSIVLDKYVNLLSDREKNKNKEGSSLKADSTLEREARGMVAKQMNRYFTAKKNRETLDYSFGKFVNSITTTMDPHSNYFPPVDLRTFNEGISGSFFGIGAQLKEDDGQIKIGTLVTGMPAWKSGEIKEGDAITKVAQGDGEPVDVTGFAVEDAVKLIRGSENTPVKLTLKTIEGTEKVVTLVRKRIDLESTYAKSAVINGQNKIGYIFLPEFYTNVEEKTGRKCAVDVAKEIEKLKAQNVQAIVMDLRGNGGGSLWEVVQMAGLFIDKGPICQVKSRDSKPQVLEDTSPGVLWDGPLAVIVDEESASASEIFAAAIQDYKRGIIIGSTSTYGKGTVQRNIPLSPQNINSIFGSSEKEDLGTVKLTLQKFYRINGDATQMKGVVSDIVLPDNFDFLERREKDNPNALKYDQIGKANYSVWPNIISSTPIVEQANNFTGKSAIFIKIREEMENLKKEMDRNIPLNIVAFKEDKAKNKLAIEEIAKLYKLQKPLNVINIDADTTNTALPKEDLERHKQFVKSIAGDIYLDETIKVLDKIIVQTNLARKD